MVLWMLPQSAIITLRLASAFGPADLQSLPLTRRRSFASFVVTARLNSLCSPFKFPWKQCIQRTLTAEKPDHPLRSVPSLTFANFLLMDHFAQFSLECRFHSQFPLLQTRSYQLQTDP